MARVCKNAKDREKPRFPLIQSVQCEHYRRVMGSLDEFFCLDCKMAYRVMAEHSLEPLEASAPMAQ